MNYDAILENKSPGFLQHFERKKVIYFPEHCKIRKNAARHYPILFFKALLSLEHV